MTTTSSSPTRSHLFSPVAMSERRRHRLALRTGGDHAHLARGHAVDRPRCRPARRRAPLMMPSRRARARRSCPSTDRASPPCGPLATAASIICCTRCMWLAKQATTMRLPGRAAKTRRRVTPDRGLRFGEPGLLGVGGVRQEQADALGAGQLPHARQIGAPAVDRLQVELEVARVEDRRPGGCGRRSPRPSGTEWVTGMNSTSQGPIRTRSPSATEMKSVRSAEAGLLDAVPGQADA